jgi:hypothetical protein
LVGDRVVTKLILNLPVIVPWSKNSLNGPAKPPVVNDVRVVVEESCWTPVPNGLAHFAGPKFAAVGAGCVIVANSVSAHETFVCLRCAAADAGTVSPVAATTLDKPTTAAICVRALRRTVHSPSP